MTATSDWLKPPNILVYMRMLAVILVVFFYYLPWQWGHYVAAGLFILAAATDWLDGYLARNWSWKTKLGEFLDPVADKLLVVLCLVLMAEAYDSVWITCMVMIILAREIIVMAIRHWAAGMENNPVPKGLHVSILGKIKTTLQMSSLIWFLAFPPGGDNLLPHWIAIVILTAATIMTLWSGSLYAYTLAKNYVQEDAQ